MLGVILGVGEEGEREVMESILIVWLTKCWS
jgi:hypothetical protein